MARSGTTKGNGMKARKPCGCRKELRLVQRVRDYASYHWLVVNQFAVKGASVRRPEVVVF